MDGTDPVASSYGICSTILGLEAVCYDRPDSEHIMQELSISVGWGNSLTQVHWEVQNILNLMM